jgi:hypothetical protein
VRLIQILFRITDANVGRPASERDILAESILVKFVNHAISILYLLRQTKIPELEASYLDIAGINVLTRAMLETAFVFAYLFNLPKDSSEREFRGDAWMLFDLVSRQEYGIPREEFRAQVERERQKIGLMALNCGLPSRDGSEPSKECRLG